LAAENTKLPLGSVMLLLCLSGLGCGGHNATASRTPANPRETLQKPNKLELEQLVVTPASADTIGKIHDRGMHHLQNGAYAAAERDFDLCVRASPEGPFAASALYHGALALDELGKFELALARFLQVAERFGDDPLGQEAALRAVRLACHLERWQVARALAERVLESHQPLRPIELVLLQGALAIEAVVRGDDVSAEQYVARARNAIEDNGLDAPGKIPRDIAAVYFALGELRRLRAERIPLVPPPSNFSELLEQRCELLLSAQSAYSDSMRALDAHWSTMAGYRIGELYSSLHQELMRIVPPDSVQDLAKRQLFEGAMRLRYSVLVQKASNMMKHTLAMAERNHEQSAWVTRAQAAAQDLERRLLDEQAAIDRLPYSRQALEYALYALGAGKPKAR
jgi:tetratricopeptide (TPR) repeat protein